MKKYDLIIIGGGGGLKLIEPATRAGKKVAMIEKEFMGGTCLNRGCIPSKMLIHVANVVKEAKESKKLGIKVENVNVNFSSITKRIFERTNSDALKVAEKLKHNKLVDFYNEECIFVSDTVLKIGNKKITAKKIIIASGARPSIPSISGLNMTPYWTSKDALRAKKIPKKLIVIGGGYIAAELGFAYRMLGAEVEFIVLGKLIEKEDKQVSEEFSRIFEKENKVHYIKKIESVSYDKNRKKFSVKYEDEIGKIRISNGEKLLVATGVRPNTDILELENTSIKTDNKGFIKVDKNMQTNVKEVYAIGDCVGNYLFRHGVNFEAEYLCDKLFENKKGPIKYPPMPHAIFSNPEVASVGMTEEILKEKDIPYVVGMNRYENSAMGMALMSESGFVKLLFHKKNKKLLGAHIIGDNASIMIHIVLPYLTIGSTVDDMMKMIYVHPALPEILKSAIRKAKYQFKN